ncbi:MAG: alpha/beta hydrolase [Sphingobacteriaceae bacterium]
MVKTSFLLFSIIFCCAALSFAQKPVFVIVHGAYGGGWSYKATAEILENDGSKVYCPTLTGLGDRVHLSNADINLSVHIEDIVNTILYEDLQDVILVGHSYGGMVISGVADSIPERIKKLVFIDALLPENGESAVNVISGGKSGTAPSGSNGFLIPSWVLKGKAAPKDEPHPIKTFLEPIVLKNPQAAKLPATFILTIDEGKRPEDDGFFFSSQRAKKRGYKVIYQTGDHNLQFTNIPVLAKLLAQEID